MTKIKDFLTSHPLTSLDQQYKLIEVNEYFNDELRDVENAWPILLYKFISEIPFRYWNKENVLLALNLLEKDKQRTIEGLERFASRLNIAVTNIDIVSKGILNEKSISLDKPLDLIILSTEIQPEYLRLSEHIFGNLICLSWFVINKAKNSKYVPKNAVSVLRSNGIEHLTEGFDDDIRNKLAHGRVSYTDYKIIYEDEHGNKSVYVDAFLKEFDNLIKTNNALIIGLILFLARNDNIARKVVPSSLLVRLAFTHVDRTGMKFLGAPETIDEENNKITIHVAYESEHKSRNVSVLDILHLSKSITEYSTNRYVSITFQINHPKINVPSQILIDPIKFREHYDKNVDIDQMQDVLGNNALLWHDESAFVAKLRVLKYSFVTYYKYLYPKLLWHEHNIKTYGHRYFIKEVEERNILYKVRLNIVASLKYPEDADDVEALKKITKSIINKYKWKFYWVGKGSLGKERFILCRRPTYIWVNLYKNEMSLRQISQGGWFGDNLLLIAEKIRGINKPIAIKKLSEKWKGILFQFESPISKEIFNEDY